MSTNQEALPKNLLIAINSNITRCYENSKIATIITEHSGISPSQHTIMSVHDIFGKQLFVISHNNKLKGIHFFLKLIDGAGSTFNGSKFVK